MGRPDLKEIEKTKDVHMKIPYDLWVKSKALIHNRTEDYIDYLKRRIAASDRLDMLQQERDEVRARLEHLDIEIDHELNMKEELKCLEKEVDEIIEDAVKTITHIVMNEGVIGLDKIEQIATVKDLSFGELKNAIPLDLRDKVVNFHPQIIGEKGTEGLDF